MRYFIYRDSQVLGPFSPEEIDQSGGLSPDGLVCAESASGRQDSDWLSPHEIPELSSVRQAAGAATAVLDEPAPFEAGALERLELETLGSPGAVSESGDWLLDLFDDAEFHKRWGDLIPKSFEDAEAISKARISTLTDQVEELKARIRDLESRPAPAKAAPPATSFKPRPWTPAEPSAEPPPAAAQPSTGATAFQRQGERFTFSGKPKGPEKAPPRIKFMPSQAFRVIEKIEPPPVAGAAAPEAFSAQGPGPAGAAPVYEWRQPTQPPAPGLPAAASSPAPAFGGLEAAAPAAAAPPAPTAELPSLGPPPTSPPTLTPPAPTLPPASEAAGFAPPVTLTPPPAAVPASNAPPMTTMFGSPAPAAQPVDFGGQAAAPTPTLEPPPLPQMPVFGSPATGIFAGPGVAAPAALTPSRSNEGAITPAGPATEDVIARLAKPADTAPSTADKPKKRRFVALPVIGLLVVLLSVLAFVFLHRHPQDLKTMVSMDTGQRPIGSPVEEPEPKALPPLKPQAPAPTIQSSVPQAAPRRPAPAPSSDAIPDPGQAAVALVKNYPLTGDRGTVGSWLSYSYTADPAAGNKEEWSAGAVEATTYAVEYKVRPGPNSALKEPISLLFEADTAHNTVQGKNQAAQRLLAGGEPAAPKKPAKKAVYRKKAPKKAAPQPEPKKVDLLPLPSDADLLPPAEDDAGFKTDTVQPGL